MKCLKLESNEKYIKINSKLLKLQFDFLLLKLFTQLTTSGEALMPSTNVLTPSSVKSSSYSLPIESWLILWTQVATDSKPESPILIPLKPSDWSWIKYKLLVWFKYWVYFYILTNTNKLCVISKILKTFISWIFSLCCH